MNYTEYREKKQKEFNALPIFFAFGQKQFDAALAERGATVKDIYRLGGTGGYYLKRDADKIREYFNRADELPKLMQDREFAVDAFKYEMYNHEYGYNWQADFDVCECFCACEWGEEKTYVEYLTEGGYDRKVIGYYREAKAEYYREADE